MPFNTIEVERHGFFMAGQMVFFSFDRKVSHENSPLSSVKDKIGHRLIRY